MPTTITSLDDPRVDDYVGLRDRKESDTFLIAETPVVIERLVKSSLTIRSFFLTPKAFERMWVTLQHVDAPVYVAEPEVMESITGFEVHRGVLASANRPKMPGLLDLMVRSKRLVVLEGSNDHENIGAIARSVRALGFDGMVLDRKTDKGRTVNASMNAPVLFTLVNDLTKMQINAAVAQMDQDVQKNAAMVEETTAATHNLRRETEALIASISSFKLAMTNASARSVLGKHIVGEDVRVAIRHPAAADRLGPTAVLKSAAKMDHIKTGGTLLNMKFAPELLAGDAGIDRLHGLVRSYFKMDGHHVQFNVVTADTLRAAKADPANQKKGRPFVEFARELKAGGMTAVVASFVLSLVAHFLVGAAKSLITVRSWWRSGFEMMVVGVIVAVVTYGLGALFHVQAP